MSALALSDILCGLTAQEIEYDSLHLADCQSQGMPAALKSQRIT